MPLMKSGSKKAFEKNVKTEMEAHPDKKKQDLAIAYNVQRQNKKKAMPKMAEGGMAKEPEFGAMSADSLSPIEKSMLGSFRAHIAKGGTSDNFSMESMKLAGKEDSADAEHMMANGGSISGKPVASWTDGGDVTESSDQDSMDMDRRISMQGQGLRATDAGQRVDEDSRTPEEMSMMADGGSVAEMIRMKKKAKMMADGGEVDLSWNGKEHENMEDDLSFDAMRKDRIMGEDLDGIKQPKDSNEDGRELKDEDSHDMVGSIRKRMKMRKM